MTDRPTPCSDGDDFSRHLDELVPGEAAGVENAGVGFEDAVRPSARSGGRIPRFADWRVILLFGPTRAE
jgi:hypothetical protein